MRRYPQLILDALDNAPEEGLRVADMVQQFPEGTNDRKRINQNLKNLLDAGAVLRVDSPDERGFLYRYDQSPKGRSARNRFLEKEGREKVPVNKSGTRQNYKGRVIDALKEHPEGGTVVEVAEWIDAPAKAVENVLPTLFKRSVLIRWKQPGTVGFYYKIAPSNQSELFITTPQKAEKPKSPAPEPPSDASVASALDAFSVIVADRETYKQALEQIAQIINTTLEK